MSSVGLLQKSPIISVSDILKEKDCVCVRACVCDCQELNLFVLFTLISSFKESRIQYLYHTHK